MTRVDIVCTDPRHGVHPRLERWAARVAAQASVAVHRDTATLAGGDILFLVSCQQIVGRAVRDLYRHTLVLHASDLPRWRGMSPHVWQILAGQPGFTVTLLEAEDAFDTGRIWHQQDVAIAATALFDEINAALFDAEIALMDWALAHAGDVVPRAQHGEPTVARRRTPADSRIDPARPLVESFDLLRVADPDRYPAFFEHRGQRYRIRIDKLESLDP